MSKTFKSKRRIEKVRNSIDTTLTNSVTTLVMHEAEDAKTLVRTIIDLNVVRLDAVANISGFGLILQLEPAGVLTVVLSLGQALDVPAINNLVWEHQGVDRIGTVVGSFEVQHVFADIKGMRKMKETDQITLVHLADNSNNFIMRGTVTMFFKE